ncbi:hypothetical protein [Thalassotalea profundi]|uniref:DUF3630 family protein n=1 Tax=Thalassotalea profundi TaxID=2036687 RepID=A0ABQ3IH45_9GAMM|nr:hypothetical protein [Thalassotalea profundi]GHE80199.1 hypothetical protein GCM10011501_05040 [Thalassotalea profundi]
MFRTRKDNDMSPKTITINNIEYSFEPFDDVFCIRAPNLFLSYIDGYKAIENDAIEFYTAGSRRPSIELNFEGSELIRDSILSWLSEFIHVESV